MSNKFKLCVVLFSLFNVSCQGTPDSGIVNPPVGSPSVSPPVQVSSPSPTSIPTISPTPVPSAEPTPINSPAPDIAQNATLNGNIYDQSGRLVNGAKVSIKSLDENVKLETSTTTINGSYVFRDIPVGTRILVKAENGNDWTVREQTVVLKSNVEGVTNSNVVDFGDPFPAGDVLKFNNFFLSSAPEVIKVELTPSDPVPHYGFSLKITFNEPVNKELVEEYLNIRAVRNGIGGSAIIGNSTDPIDYKAVLEKGNGLSFSWDTATLENFGAEVICNISGTTGVYTSNLDKVSYALTLRGSEDTVKLTDKNNLTGLSLGEFYLNGIRRRNFIFSVAVDTKEPSLESISLFERNSNKEIRINFSEPMTVIGNQNRDILNLNFYTFYKNGNKITLDASSSADFASSKSVSVIVPQNTFSSGDEIAVEVSHNLKDPAGNFFSRGVLNGEVENRAEEEFD